MNLNNLITVDVETFYSRDYSLKKMTTTEYVRDPRFETILWSVKIGAAPGRWLTEQQFRQFLDVIPVEQCLILAHHTQFDGFVLAEHYLNGRKPLLWLDTLAMARAIFGGGRRSLSLENLAKMLGLGAKGTEVHNAIGKHLKDFTAEELEAYGQYGINDVELCYQIFMILQKYLPREELLTIDDTIRWYTEPEFMIDVPLLLEAQADEIAHKEALVARTGMDSKQLSSTPQFADWLRSMGVEPPMKPSPTRKDPDTGKAVIIPALSKSDVEFMAMLDHPNPLVAAACEARLGVKSTLRETRAGRFVALSGGDGSRPAPVYLNYAAAGTQRWTGGDKVNWQNLDRVNKKDPRKGKIRRAIMAPIGMACAVADSSQIEARTLAYLAGERFMLDQWELNLKADVYSAMATGIYGRPVDRKRVEADEEAGFVGKVTVLGAGYGIGFAKFGQQLSVGIMGGDPVIFTHDQLSAMGVSLHAFLSNQKKVRKALKIPHVIDDEDWLAHMAGADHVINTYRHQNPRIVSWWRFLETALWAMVRGTEWEWNGWRVSGDRIVRPNGLSLWYPELQYKEPKKNRTEEDEDDPEASGGFSYFNGKFRTRLYGGLLAENFCQAFARDIMAYHMRMMRSNGLRVKTSTHDEAVALVPLLQAEEKLKLMLQIMHTQPEWAKGLPLAAEGNVAIRYGDAK